MFRNIITLTAIALTIGCNDVPDHEHNTTNTETVQEEVSETRAQFEVLITECDPYDNTISLDYNDVVIISMTHITGSNLREPVEGWRQDDDSDAIMVASCQENVEVVYMYR